MKHCRRLCLEPDESSAENQLSTRARAANIKTNLGQTLPAMCENKNQITKFHIKVNELVKPRRCILRILKPSTLHKIKYTLEKYNFDTYNLETSPQAKRHKITRPPKGPNGGAGVRRRRLWSLTIGNQPREQY